MENEQNKIVENQEVLYDCRQEQKIPIKTSTNGATVRNWHHLRPLSNERYFQFENKVELLKYERGKSISEIYKPHFELWQELLIEREGAAQKDTDALFVEAVQAVRALTFFHHKTAMEIEPDKPFYFDDDPPHSIFFGSIQSGVWIDLEIEFKNGFQYDLDGFQETQMLKKTIGLHRRASNLAQRLHKFALPNITNVYGYESGIESVPAGHIVNATNALFTANISLLNHAPLIKGVDF